MTHIAPATTSEQPADPPQITWIAVWARAVIVPAWRRATAAWLGCTIVAAVLFGQAGMRAGDLTGLALHIPGVGLVLGVTWLLVFAPSARLIVRAEPAKYLASLPGDPWLACGVAGVALVGLQLPWLALWVTGEGIRGLAIVCAMTLVIVALALWRPAAVRAVPSIAWRSEDRSPGPIVRRASLRSAWPTSGRALRAIHLRALRRRAGDALVRGAGLAVLAGATAGLVIRNNHLAGETAGVLGAALIAIIVVPAQIGTALVTLGAHRETAWLAAATGIAPRTRIAALIYATALVHIGASAIAVGAATLVAGPHGWLPILSLGVALGTALAEARTMLSREDSPSVASRVVVAAVLAAALAIVCLAVLDAAGALATLAIGGFLVLTVRA